MVQDLREWIRNSDEAPAVDQLENWDLMRWGLIYTPWYAGKRLQKTVARWQDPPFYRWVNQLKK